MQIKVKIKISLLEGESLRGYIASQELDAFVDKYQVMLIKKAGPTIRDSIL